MLIVCLDIGWKNLTWIVYDCSTRKIISWERRCITDVKYTQRDLSIKVLAYLQCELFNKVLKDHEVYFICEKQLHAAHTNTSLESAVHALSLYNQSLKKCLGFDLMTSKQKFYKTQGIFDEIKFLLDPENEQFFVIPSTAGGNMKKESIRRVKYLMLVIKKLQNETHPAVPINLMEYYDKVFNTDEKLDDLTDVLLELIATLDILLRFKQTDTTGFVRNIHGELFTPLPQPEPIRQKQKPSKKRTREHISVTTTY